MDKKPATTTPIKRVATATTVRTAPAAKPPATSGTAAGTPKRSSTLSSPTTATTSTPAKKPASTSTTGASATGAKKVAPTSSAPVKAGPPSKATSAKPTSTTSTTTARNPIAKPSTPIPRINSSTPKPPATPPPTAAHTPVREAQDASTNTDPPETPSSEDDIDDLKSQIAVLESSLESRDIEVLTLQNQLDEIQAEANTKQNSFASELNTESVFEKLESENLALQRQIAALRKEKEDEVGAMKEELDIMTSRIRSESLEADSSHEAELANLRQAIAAQTQQLQSVLLEVSHLKESNHAKDFELARSARDYLTLQSGIAKAAMVEDAKKDELEFARESIESGRARIHELEMKVEELETIVAAASREFNEYEQEKISLMAQIEAGNDAVSKVEVLSASLESVKQAFEGDKLAAIQSATAVLENEKSELLKQLDLLRVAHEQELQFSELLQQSGATDSNENQSTIAESASAEIQTLQDRVKELEEVIVQIQEERKADIADFTQEKAALLNQVAVGTSALDQVKELSASVESLQQALESEKQHAISLASSQQTEKSQLSATILSLQTQVSTLTQQLEAATEAHKETSRALAEPKEPTNLEYNLQNAQKEVQILQERLSLAESSLSQKTAQLAAKERDHAATVLETYTQLETIGKLQEKVNHLQEDLDHTRENLGGLSSAHTQLIEHHGVLHSTASHADIQSHTLAGESLDTVVKQKEEIEAIKSALDTALTKILVLQEKQDELQQQLQSSDNHVLVLEQNVSQLKLLLAEEENKAERLTAQLSSLLGDSSVELLLRKKNALDTSKSDAEKIVAYEKLVSELEIQLVSADFRALNKVRVAGVRSPIMTAQQLRIVNEE
ncbi:hypothetical protein BDR26DRAFT_894819 [Obelidium mucronatum]|nr:hypothetical protein BDR26DRAFT_894819 [Obelidium mucronatum]